MGKATAEQKAKAAEVESWAVAALAPVADITTKKMFGGYGIFGNGVMFAMVTSAAELHLRAGPDHQARYEAAGSHRHGRMPYWSVPSAVTEDLDTLVAWATDALATSQAAKSR